MSPRTRFMIGLAGLVLLVLLALVIGSRLERYEETVDQGPSPHAKANPYLAAADFLRQRTITVRMLETLSDLPDPHQHAQTLLLLEDRSYMTPAQTQRLLDWANNGGHLLFVAEQLWDEQTGSSGDLLLDRIRVRQYLSKDLADEDANADNARPAPPIPLMMAPPASRQAKWPELTRLYLENEDAPAYMSFDPAFHLEDPEDLADTWANSANTTHMLQIRQGQGLITVVSDAELWKTHNIGKYDNAWLLWYLTQDSDVTMVLQTKHENLLTPLLRHFWLAGAMLGLLVALSVWRLSVREGPILLPASRARRQLTEHLRASAEFLRRRSGQQTLLKSLQQDVLRRARQRHPGFERLPVAEQWQVLSRLTRLPTSAISDALRPRPQQRFSHSEFTRQVAHLQTLRNAL